MAVTANGTVYFVTEAYIAGAQAAASMQPRSPNPYKSGPKHAQFNYGYDNERAGHHDHIDELQEEME